MSRKTHFDIALEFWIWVFELKWENFWVFGSEKRWEKASKWESSKWESVTWRLGWCRGCWVEETEGQFGHRRWSRLRVHKNDNTFHIKSWFSYFPLLGFENAIMLGWEAQSITFPKKRKWNDCLLIKARETLYIYIYIMLSIWFFVKQIGSKPCNA